MDGSVDPQGAGEFARPRAEIFERRHVATMGHFLDSPRGFQSTNQNKAILAPTSHEKVQQPVDSVVQIHIRSASRHACHKLPRGRSGKSMTRLIVQYGISLGLNNHASATVPNELAADHLARTSHRIAFEKFGLNVHATLSVNRAQKRSNFVYARTLGAHRPLGGPSSRMAQISITDGAAVLPDTTPHDTARTTPL